MFERIFSIKALQLNQLSPSSPMSNKRGKASIGEYQLQVMNNFRMWKAAQIEKGRHDIATLYTDLSLL